MSCQSPVRFFFFAQPPPVAIAPTSENRLDRMVYADAVLCVGKLYSQGDRRIRPVEAAPHTESGGKPRKSEFSSRPFRIVRLNLP